MAGIAGEEPTAVGRELYTPDLGLMPHEAAARDLLIVAATETNTDEDFVALEQALKEVLA